MKISVGADHAGFELKDKIVEKLRSEGHEVVDHGTNGADSTDYPDYAFQVGHDVSGGTAERGILVCSTGVGMSIAANKVTGIRAALAVNDDAVRLTRQHNDANVLTLGAKYVDAIDAGRFVEIFLTTGFQGGRHARRVGKIMSEEE